MNDPQQHERLWRQLIGIFRDSGLEVVLGRHREHVLDRLAELDAEYRRQLAFAGSTSSTLPPAATAADIIDTYDTDPYSVRALLQALAFNCSAEMLAMMWIVMRGARITNLQFRYERRQAADTSVTVRLPEGGHELTFKSQSIWDVAILRFAGLSTTDDHPLVDGFYPLHLGERRG